MLRNELDAYLQGLLEPARFRDYCPNGLQVEGRATVKRVVCGVTASQALVDAAIERAADAIVVHHGWFWKGEDGRVTGIRKRRLQTLLAHDINLFAFHLPLDAHATLGNNAQLAQRMGWQICGRFAEQDIGFFGTPAAPVPASVVASQVSAVLGRQALLIGDETRLVRTLAWCSGGAQDYFEPALLTGADLFVSGEISEQTVHLARESGIPYLAAGHHATERYGVMALGERLTAECGLECEFVEIENPI